MKKVRTEGELLGALQGSKDVVLIECRRTAGVMARYLREQGMLRRVAHIFSAPKSKKRKAYQGIPSEKLQEVEVLPRGTYLVVELREGHHLPVLEELDRRGISQPVLVDYELFAELSQRENPRLDFMCVGFTKCGTTSLNNAFRQHREIKMPTGKETFYLHWRNSYDDAPERFWKKYFSDVPEGKLLGNVEPSYHVSARGVYECFGGDIKLIFMVREPVGATFSYYKMLMRRPRKMDYVNYYKQYRKYSAAIFSDFIEDKIYTEEIDRFRYDKWIGEYLKYFSRDQIKVVVFEEFIRNPRQMMDEIQEFIGVENKQDYEELPHSNDGGGVSRGYLSAYINYRYYMSIRNRKENIDLSLKQRTFYRFAKWAQKYTTVENKEKPTAEQTEELQAYYRPSVRRLGELLGRDLEDIWY